MSALPKRKLTAAEYLEIERAAELKSEFYAGGMFAMSGASPAHNTIKENLVAVLGNALRGSGCYTLSGSQRVCVDATGLYTYPDVLVMCGPVVLTADDPDTLVNPKVIVEVLPDALGRLTPWAKLHHYQQSPSVTEHVLIEQHVALVSHYHRRPDGQWYLRMFDELADELVFAAVSARVRLADLYDGVVFPDPPPR